MSEITNILLFMRSQCTSLFQEAYFFHKKETVMDAFALFARRSFPVIVGWNGNNLNQPITDRTGFLPVKVSLKKFIT
jgi:hypothetical protein